MCARTSLNRWLSEIAKRKKPDEELKGDEDGPPDDGEETKEEKGEADETSDESDATSSDHENADAFRVPVHVPTKDTEGAVYEGYFERQREARCGIHVSRLLLHVIFEHIPCNDNCMFLPLVRAGHQQRARTAFLQ